MSNVKSDAVTFTFGDNEALCNELLELIRSGDKTATCGALREFGPGGDAMPVVGRNGGCDDELMLVFERFKLLEDLAKSR